MKMNVQHNKDERSEFYFERLEKKSAANKKMASLLLRKDATGIL